MKNHSSISADKISGKRKHMIEQIHPIFYPLMNFTNQKPQTKIFNLSQHKYLIDLLRLSWKYHPNQPVNTRLAPED